LIDPATGLVVSAPAEGTSTLLDTFTVTKPEVEETLTAKLSAPRTITSGTLLSYTLSISNRTGYALNGTQAIVTLPKGVDFSGTPGDAITQNGREVVITIGRLEAAETRNVHVEVKIPAAGNEDAMLVASASVRSATAMPVHTNDVRTRVEGGHKHAVSMNEEHK
jgi:uncharacterized membrane protein